MQVHKNSELDMHNFNFLRRHELHDIHEIGTNTLLLIIKCEMLNLRSATL